MCYKITSKTKRNVRRRSYFRVFKSFCQEHGANFGSGWFKPAEVKARRYQQNLQCQIRSPTPSQEKMIGIQTQLLQSTSQFSDFELTFTKLYIYCNVNWKSHLVFTKKFFSHVACGFSSCKVRVIATKTLQYSKMSALLCFAAFSRDWLITKNGSFSKHLRINMKAIKAWCFSYNMSPLSNVN